MMKKVNPYDLSDNPFDLLNRQWALVTTRAAGRINTMTASWGGLGVLWNKPVATVYVRPQRFTRELLDQSDLFSLCFLPKSFLQEKNYCGKISGRDKDKLSDCSLDVIDLDDAPVLSASALVLTCKKLYVQRLESECFTDPTIVHTHYPQADFHFMYIAQILGAYAGETSPDYHRP